jgi:hypothetical protein
MPNDKTLAAGHEAAHRTLAEHLGAGWSAAWIWPGVRRWDGLCRHFGVDMSLTPLIAAAGAAGEALMHGYRHPSDTRQFVGAEDRAAMKGTGMEGALQFARHVLGGQRRAEWNADTTRLGDELRIGEWGRSRHPPPPEWRRPTLAADEAPPPPLIVKGMKPMSEDPGLGAGVAKRLLAYLDERASLSPEQLADVQSILSGQDILDPGGLASDSALRQRAPTRSSDRFLQRFPNANRLSQRYG